MVNKNDSYCYWLITKYADKKTSIFILLLIRIKSHILMFNDRRNAQLKLKELIILNVH